MKVTAALVLALFSFQIWASHITHKLSEADTGLAVKLAKKYRFKLEKFAATRADNDTCYDLTMDIFITIHKGQVADVVSANAYKDANKIELTEAEAEALRDLAIKINAPVIEKDKLTSEQRIYLSSGKGCGVDPSQWFVTYDDMN